MYVKSENWFQGIWPNNLCHTHKRTNNGRYAYTNLCVLSLSDCFTLGGAVVERDKLSSAPSLAELTVWRPGGSKTIEIIKAISSRWQEIGYLLNFDSVGQTIEQIKANEKQVELCCRAMFQHWLQGNGRLQPATWAILIQILEDCDFKNLAKEIRDSLRPTQYAVDIHLYFDESSPPCRWMFVTIDNHKVTVYWTV